jgi:hypothetical protein
MGEANLDASSSNSVAYLTLNRESIEMKAHTARWVDLRFDGVDDEKNLQNIA